MAVIPPRPSGEDRPLLLYVVTEDWYFVSHRLALAQAAQAAGWRVAVATRVKDHGDPIRAAGIEVHRLNLDRGGRNPARELLSIARLLALYRRLRPAVVHHVAWKPTLHGTIAARLAGAPRIVNALAGLGFLFSSDRRSARWIKPAALIALRLALRAPNVTLIVQNPDDRAALLDRRVVDPAQVALIRGLGVDVAALQPTPEPAVAPSHPLLALCVGRLLFDKGVAELVEAGRLLAARGAPVRLAMAGGGDAENPANIPQTTLDAWAQEDAVEFLGRREDIPALWRQAAIAVLPSYREGLPKALLEAAACGRPLVATDVPGCRDVCRHEDTGLLVPARDPAALADAIERLARDPALRARLGSAARRAAEEEFSLTAVIEQTLALYRWKRQHSTQP